MLSLEPSLPVIRYHAKAIRNTIDTSIIIIRPGPTAWITFVRMGPEIAPGTSQTLLILVSLLAKRELFNSFSLISELNSGFILDFAASPERKRLRLAE